MPISITLKVAGTKKNGVQIALAQNDNPVGKWGSDYGTPCGENNGLMWGYQVVTIKQDRGITECSVRKIRSKLIF